jgi:hypothetical protein
MQKASVRRALIAGGATLVTGATAVAPAFSASGRTSSVSKNDSQDYLGFPDTHGPWVYPS